MASQPLLSPPLPHMATIPVIQDPDHPHHAYEYGPSGYGRISAALKRVSWGAIFAGAAVGAMLHFLLYLLGIGIGLQTFDPATENDTLGGFGIGQGVWLVVSGLIALFVAGWIAGRLAGMPRRTDGAVHGLVTWAVATIVALYFLSSGIGTILGGVRSVVAGGADLAGQGIAAAAPRVADAVGQNVDLSEIRAEAGRLARDVATTPGDAGADLDAAIDRTLGGPGPVSGSNREELVQTLAARTGMSEAEARQTVSQWEVQADAARQQIQQTVQTVREDAPQVAEDATDAVGTAALWGFFALLLGATAAVFGGLIGSPHDLPAAAVRRETAV